MMQSKTLFFTCVTLVLTGQIQSLDDEECGLASDSLMSDSNGSQIHCNSNIGARAFLRSLPFRVGDDMSVLLDIDEAICFYPACCNRLLRDRRLLGEIKGSIDYEGVTRVGDSIGSFSCIETGQEIIASQARCDRLEVNGSGWNYLTALDGDGTLCRPCPAGSFLEDGATQCKPCPRGHFSDVEGATECEPCSRGRYTTGEGATQCLYCPAGHTTYRYSLNACVGPQLNVYSDNDISVENVAYTALVSHDTLGSLQSAEYWSSVGDWELLTGDKAFSTIREKFTSSYRREPRRILKKLVSGAQPIVENVYCYKDSELYRGYVEKTASGKKCTGPRQHCTTTNRGRVCYCGNRRPNHGRKPYCETETGAEEDCDIPKCADQQQENEPCSYKRHDGVSENSFGSAPTKFNEFDAKRICDKLGGECTGVWGKGNSWKVTGVSLSEVEMGSGTQTFYVKSPDCVNPYYEYYFEQRWGS